MTRAQLGALLLCSFAIQVLRLVSGQLLALLGLLTCLVGNKARCSLCDWDLWLLVVLATCAATLDVLSLLPAVDERLSFERLKPCQRVAMLGAVAAPVLELLCVQARRVEELWELALLGFR